MIIKKQPVEPQGEAMPAADEAAETAQIPLSIIGEQSVEPGDKIQLTVVSVDSDSGVINVTYDHEKSEPKPMGSDSMAEAYKAEGAM